MRGAGWSIMGSTRNYNTTLSLTLGSISGHSLNVWISSTR